MGSFGCLQDAVVVLVFRALRLQCFKEVEGTLRAGEAQYFEKVTDHDVYSLVDRLHDRCVVVCRSQGA